MDWIEYKLKNGIIAMTNCPDLRKKLDGEIKKVGSTACMLCCSNRGMTFYDDGSGGMVKCEAVKAKQGKRTKKAGKKVKPSLRRKMEEQAKAKEERKLKREINKIKREAKKAEKERRLKDEIAKNNQENQADL